MPPKKILRLDSSQRKLPTFFNTTAEQNHDTVSENNETDETDGSCETTGEGASKHSSSEERKFQSKWLTFSKGYSLIEIVGFNLNLMV